jgi:hypothetical protein
VKIWCCSDPYPNSAIWRNPLLPRFDPDSKSTHAPTAPIKAPDRPSNPARRTHPFRLPPSPVPAHPLLPRQVLAAAAAGKGARMRYINNDDWGLDIVLEMEPEAQVPVPYSE